MGKEQLIPIFAVLVLFIGTGSSVYVYATQGDTVIDADVITIYKQQYTIEKLFTIVEPRAFEALNYSGIALDDLIIKVGVECPTCNNYVIAGGDGYQKTVTWENMQNGLLTSDKMTVFSDLPKAFRVRDIVEIGVIEI